MCFPNIFIFNLLDILVKDSYLIFLSFLLIQFLNLALHLHHWRLNPTILVSLSFID